MEEKIKIEHINNNWTGCTIYLDLPITRAELDKEISHLTHKTKYYELNLIEIMPGVFNFYAAQLETDEEHEAGYKWASRCSIMNEYFGVNLIDVSCYMTDNHSTPHDLGIDVQVLKEILPDNYCILKREYTNPKTLEVETSYMVIDRSHLSYYLTEKESVYKYMEV